jgi:hypothetical protein
MSAATSIPRMRIAETESLMNDERVKLANEAASVLGYRRMARAISAPKSLAATLRALEIDPLYAPDVERYKTKKAKPGMWESQRLAIVFACALPFPLALFLYLGEISKWDATDVPWHGPLAFCGFLLMIASALASAGLTVASVVNACGRWGTRVKRQWKRATVAEYSRIGNIPEFALVKAVAVQKALSNAELSVDRLYESYEKNSWPHMDPFLIAKLGDEEYYLDVWDEREYERLL